MATNTAASFTNHTGNGTAGPFSISFSYLSEAEVDVTVGGVLKTITTHYTFTSATQITFTSGNEPANGAVIKIQRDTNVGSKKIDFNDGSVLTESDLDTQNDQLLFAVQEITDNFVKKDGSQVVTGNLVFEGSVDDTNETTLAITNPTADRTITLPDTTGTVVTTGDTGTVTSTMIADGTIAAGDLASNSVTTAKITDANVTTAKVADDAITSAKIADGAITSAHIAADTVVAADIAANAITASELADDAVDTAAIANSAVTNAKLGADAVNGSKIADDSIDSEHYVDGSIDTAHIADSQITTGKLADNSVTTAKITDANITTAKISNDAVTGAKIADDSINSEHYVDSSIDTAHIADAQITTAKIADDAVTAAKVGTFNLADLTNVHTATPSDGQVLKWINSNSRWEPAVDAGASGATLGDGDYGDITVSASGAVFTIDNDVITSAKIADDAVGADQLAANTVVTGSIVDDAVTQAKVADNAIGADQIAANAVGASELADNAVDTAAIAADAVTSAKVADDAIGTDQLANTSVTAGSYTLSSITVDAQGRITAASSGTAGASDKITEGNTEAEVVDTGSDGHFKVTTEGSERFRVAANGNVGIGSSTPGELLQIYDASGNPTIHVRANNQNTASLKFENDDGDWTISSGTSSYPLNFAVGGSNKLTILNDGKVGIGDTTPSTALEVNGTVTATAFAGSGANLTAVDAATVDGIDSASFLRSDAADSASGLLSLNGGIALTGKASANITALSDGATITVDMATACHHSVTLGGNRTFAAPSNQAVGQAGSIFITQDGTGSRTASFNSAFKFVGGTAPTLTTTASAVDRIDYVILSSNVIHCAVSLDVK